MSKIKKFGQFINEELGIGMTEKEDYSNILLRRINDAIEDANKYGISEYEIKNSIEQDIVSWKPEIPVEDRIDPMEFEELFVTSKNTPDGKFRVKK